MRNYKKYKKTNVKKRRENTFFRWSSDIFFGLLSRNIFYEKSGPRKKYLQRDVYSKKYEFSKQPAKKNHLDGLIHGIRNPKNQIIFLSGIILVWGYILFYSPYFQIQTYKIDGLQLIEKQQIESIINEYLSSRRFFILPQNNLYTFDESRFIEQLQASFGLKWVGLDINTNTKSLLIGIQEKDIAYVLQAEQKYYYVDSKGQLITEALNSADAISEYPVIYYEVADNPTSDLQLIPEPMLEAIKLTEDELYLRTRIKIASYKIITPDTVKLEQEVFEEKKEDQNTSDENQIAEAQASEDTLEPDEEKDPLAITEEDILLETYEVAPEVHAKELVAVTKDGWEIYFGNEIFLDSEDLRSRIFHNLVVGYNNLKKDQKSLQEYMDLRFEDRVYYK